MDFSFWPQSRVAKFFPAFCEEHMEMSVQDSCSPLGHCVCLSLFFCLFFSLSVSLWIVVWIRAWCVVVTNPPAPLAGSQCAGLFSTTVLGGSSSAPNLQDYARAHRKKFSTGSLSYKDGTCLGSRSLTNLHRATADQCLTHFLWDPRCRITWVWHPERDSLWGNRAETLGSVYYR